MDRDNLSVTWAYHVEGHGACERVAGADVAATVKIGPRELVDLDLPHQLRHGLPQGDTQSEGGPVGAFYVRDGSVGRWDGKALRIMGPLQSKDIDSD